MPPVLAVIRALFQNAVGLDVPVGVGITIARNRGFAVDHAITITRKIPSTRSSPPCGEPDVAIKRPQGDSNPCSQDENLVSWT